MKKILTLICVLFATVTFAQSSADTTKFKVGGYLSIGLSVTNYKDSYDKKDTTFFTTSYSGIEGGITYGNFGAGLVLGRGNLNFKERGISNYFYEVKTFYCFPIKRFTGTVLFGYGGYFEPNNNFIEYGGGVSYGVGHFSYGITYSNWDGVNYLTPSITYNF
jgi:hypothetical protein